MGRTAPAPGTLGTPGGHRDHQRHRAGQRRSARRAHRGRRARRARAPRPSSKPNGQWKIDGTAPLNGNEEWKQVDDGLAVRERIENIYSKGGFASIDPTDLHGRFRVWGLYTQRKPGIDGGRTATLEPHELEDEYFMLRVRIDGGQLTTEQLRVIAGISTEFGRDTADLTDRQNIQLHWIEVESMPEIWRRLEAVGLGTTEACGDVPRVVLGSPVAGIAADELIDPTPQIDEITSRFIGDPSLANLPRKFKSAITGHPSQDVVHEINDVAFVAVEHPELGIGYDLWVGGGLSTAPRLGERLGVFVAPERVADAWHGVAQIFRDYGYRRLRNKARLKFLLAEWGTEKFRQVLQDEYLGYALPDGPAAPKPLAQGDHVGVHRQKDGRFYVGATPIVGRVSGPTLAKLADLIEAHGSTRLRTTPHQKLVILDIPEDRVESLIAGLDELGLSARPSLIRRGTIACTGIEFCKLAIVETKAYATAAVLDLEERLAASTCRIRSRCTSTAAPTRAPASRPPTSASRASSSRSTASRCPGYQVHLGGGLANADRDEAGLGRTVRGLKVRRRRHRRLHRARRPPLPRRSGCRRPTRPSPSGRTAPKRRHSHDRLARTPRHRSAAVRRTARPRRGRQRRARQPHRSRGIARRGRRVGRAQLRCGCRGRGLLDGRRRAAPPRRRAAARASTCSSSTPATTSPRRASRATRSAGRWTCGSSTCCPSRPSPSRTPSSARSCSPAIPPCAARAARSHRCRTRSAATRCGSPASAAKRRRPARTRRWSRGTSATASSRSTRSRRGRFDDLLDYAGAHQVPVNLLVSNGYPSIGCEPCTSRSPPGDDPRSGRWAGLSKTECGLHV